LGRRERLDSGASIGRVASILVGTLSLRPGDGLRGHRQVGPCAIKAGNQNHAHERHGSQSFVFVLLHQIQRRRVRDDRPAHCADVLGRDEERVSTAHSKPNRTFTAKGDSNHAYRISTSGNGGVVHLLSQTFDGQRGTSVDYLHNVRAFCRAERMRRVYAYNETASPQRCRPSVARDTAAALVKKDGADNDA
jgi:hypothetical protein